MDRTDSTLPPAQGWIAAAPMILGGALLGTLGVFVHEAGADPVTTTAFRCAFGLLALTLWLGARGALGRLALTRAQLPWVLLAAGAQISGWVIFFWALGRVAIGPATVLVHVQPLWVLLMAALWLREPVARERVLSVAVSMVGLVLATGLLEPPAAAGDPDKGHAWGVAACLLAGLCNALVTMAARRLSGLAVGVLAWWQCAIGTLVLLTWPALQGWPAWGSAWAWLAGLGLIHTGLAYALIHQGTGRLSSDRVAVLQYVYPAVALAVDAGVYGHRLSIGQGIGLAVMALAIGWAERRGGAAGPKASRPASSPGRPTQVS